MLPSSGMSSGMKDWKTPPGEKWGGKRVRRQGVGRGEGEGGRRRSEWGGIRGECGHQDTRGGRGGPSVVFVVRNEDTIPYAKFSSTSTHTDFTLGSTMLLACSLS